jgi:hypothetical protein
LRTKQPQQSNSNIVGGVLETYAARGVFKGFSKTGEDAWRMLWHRDRFFDLILNEEAGTLTFPEVLPGVPARSEMMKAYRAFVAAFAAESQPEHKRIDLSKTKLKCLAKGGSAGLEAKVVDGDWDYAVRKLIHVVHETYLVFLYDGAYYEYLIETFDLDPDHMA